MRSLKRIRFSMTLTGCFPAFATFAIVLSKAIHWDYPLFPIVIKSSSFYRQIVCVTSNKDNSSQNAIVRFAPSRE
jgi:hypothetical protein